LRFGWAAIERTGAPGAASATAYHINAAVRDGEALWLSCGDWRSIDQPTKEMRDRASKTPTAVVLPYPRVWHVVVRHDGLAKKFERLLQDDLGAGRSSGAADTPVQPEPRPHLLVSVAKSSTSVSRGQPQDRPDSFHPSASRGRVQPLLSPDHYFEHVLPLIQSASKSLFFENPYIHLSPTPHPKFVELVRALRDKVNDPHLNAQLILGDTPTTRDMLEALEAIGFKMSRIRVQPGVRTQGIIVDAEAVVVGSHRWSSAGLMRDRAASLLIRGAGVAGYLQKVFDHDWKRLAGQTVSAERAMPQLADADGPAPDGMVRVPWGAVFDD
jgi:phosphatidylserine/phosphatidylglycerophosphate/cardiolipin synthase-like enzyme